jgi:hypothetical protein
LKTCKARDIEAALNKKGFLHKETHHKIFYLCMNGRITGVHTFLSHGQKEYSPDLLAKMRNQLHLSGREFTDLIQCPLTGEHYLQLLVERGVIEEDNYALK